MFDEASGNVVIVDFGLSKQSNANQTVTACGRIAGTLYYMSPEQTGSDPSSVSLPSDMWSMGIIWYEILSGITPFEPLTGAPEQWARSSAQQRSSLRYQDWSMILESKVTIAIVNDEPDWRRLREDVPGPIISVIDKCLQKQPSDRYRDASEFWEIMAKIFAELKSGAYVKKVQAEAKSLSKWSVDEICRVLDKCGYVEASKMVRDNGVDGKTWVALDEEDYKSLGMNKLKLRRFTAEVATMS